MIRIKELLKLKRLSSFQLIILGFLATILLGSLLLMLPIATKDSKGATFLDALFTSTTSVCVTGLVVQDTGTYWTLFGHIVILLLIQVGGLGVVTVAMALISASGKKISLKERSTLKEAIAAPQVRGVVKMIGFILKLVFTIELIGAVAFMPVFCKDFGIIKGIWYSIFHSISAFCNAGIDLFGVIEPYSSITSYNTQPVVNIVIMLLIITGGLGFFTWDDIISKRLNLKQYRMQSKVILATTATLIIVPAVYFFFFEFSNLPIDSRIWSSIFQAITPRTAGFNSVDINTMSNTGIMAMIILMLIGGAPGSTAGGMKVTTLSVILCSSFSVFKKQNQTVMFGRRLPDDSVRNAIAIFLMYIVLSLFCAMIISYIEEIPILTALYETASAIGTVGLTLGITPTLGTASHIILIILMYIGRVGGLTLIYATVSDKVDNGSRYPQERITVG